MRRDAGRGGARACGGAGTDNVAGDRHARRQAGDCCCAPAASRKSFVGVQALAGVDVEIRRGEILGLIGPNGSGKSTFINVVSGHYAASAGGIQFEGRDIAHLAAHRIARAGIARTYQIPRPFAHLSVRDNVAAAAMFGGAGLSASTRRATRPTIGSASPA